MEGGRARHVTAGFVAIGGGALGRLTGPCGAHKRVPRAKLPEQVHVPGVGDYVMADIALLPDPCPLPEKEKIKSLNAKERLLHAPVCYRPGPR